MSALRDPRINAPEERPSGARRMVQDTTIRVPRLLVAASELSWRFLICLAAVAVVVYGLMQIGFAVIPVAVALLLSTLLVPPARWLQARRVPRAAAAALVFIGGIALLAGAIALVAGSVAGEADDLSKQVSGGANELGGLIADLPLGISEAEVQKQIDTVDDRIRDSSSSIGSGALAGAAAAGQFLGGLVIMLVVLFFFIKDGPGMWRWLCGRFPAARQPALDELGERSWRVLTAYVRGVVIVAFVDAVGIGLGLLVVGVPLVLPLAVLTFLLAFVPIVGALVAGTAAVLVALVSEGLGAALVILAIVLLVQQLEGNVLYPFIVGRTLDLHPVVVLLAVTIGGLLYGIVGAALAVPVAVVGAAAITTIEHHSVHGEVAVGPSQGEDSGG